MEFPKLGREGSITLISGQKRSGKTILVAILSLLHAKKGIQIFSNFWMDTVKCKEVSFYEVIKMLDTEQPFQPYAILALQEIYTWANSHKALSGETDAFDTLNFQGGKLNLNIIGDSQLITRCDDSLRKLANYRFLAEKQSLCNRNICDNCRKNTICRFVYWELDKSITDRDVKTEDNFTINFKLASKFWHRYDTLKRSPILGIKNLLTSMEKHEPVLMFETIKRQTKMLYEQGQRFGINSVYDCNKIRVENALMELSESTVFSAYVTDRLKIRFQQG